MTSFGDGVWFDTDAVRVLGTRLTATMTVLRLGDGSLLVHSPVALTPPRRAFVNELGRVAHLYAPNTFTIDGCRLEESVLVHRPIWCTTSAAPRKAGRSSTRWRRLTISCRLQSDRNRR